MDQKKIKAYKRVVRNCEQRITAARKLYKAAVKEKCVFTQNSARKTIAFNNDLKAKAQAVLEGLGV